MGRNRQQVCIHLVWATWDRLPLLTDDIERHVYRYIEKVCTDDKCDVLAIRGMPDHVHLLVMLPGTIGYATLLQHVKGGSSRFISEKLKPGDWLRGKDITALLASAPLRKEKLVRYIANQKQHHADGTLWPSVEKTEEDDTS